MRVRRIIATALMGAGVALGGATAALAQSPIVTTTTAPTTTTSTTAPAVVLPSSTIQETTTTAAPTTTAPTQVRGEVLARTGQDLALPVLIGGSLAAGGAILVLGARKRRTA